MVNQVWAIDFVHDACANGQKLKCLTVAEEFTREGLAIEVAGAIRSRHVIDVLSRLVSERGAPMFIRSDNGPEFVSRAILKWVTDEGIATALIDPGKPWQNGVNESFNEQIPGRVPEHGMVPQSGRGKGGHRLVARTLQHRPAAFEPRLSHATRLRGEMPKRTSSVRACNGPGRCGTGLRAPNRRTTAPERAKRNQWEGWLLKLRVVRRTWAGQPRWPMAAARLLRRPPTAMSPASPWSRTRPATGSSSPAQVAGGDAGGEVRVCLAGQACSRRILVPRAGCRSDMQSILEAIFEALFRQLFIGFASGARRLFIADRAVAIEGGKMLVHSRGLRWASVIVVVGAAGLSCWRWMPAEACLW
jgi:hypothetical protein